MGLAVPPMAYLHLCFPRTLAAPRNIYQGLRDAPGPFGTRTRAVQITLDEQPFHFFPVCIGFIPWLVRL